MSRSIETLSKRSETGIQNLDRLQKSPIFHDKSKAELKTSKMGLISIMVQLYTKTCSGKKYK